MRIRSLYEAGILCVTLIVTSKADTIYVDSDINLSILVPENWVVTELNDSEDLLFDSTSSKKAVANIVKEAIPVNIYPTDRDWTLDHYIAYTTYVDYSTTPTGYLLETDTAPSCDLDSVWGPWCLSYFDGVDSTTGAIITWGEYERFAAVDGKGYEMYAIADTADMFTNFGFYNGLFSSIRIGTTVGVRQKLPNRNVAGNIPIGADEMGNSLLDLRGRRITDKGRCSSSLYIQKNDARDILNIKKSSQ